MNKPNAQLPIPHEILEPYIEQAVSAAIIGELGDPTEIIEKLVRNVMRQKVDENGNFSDRSYNNTLSLPEALARKTIREVIKETIHRTLTNERALIERTVEREILDGKQAIAKSIVGGMLQSLSMGWNVNVTFKEE